MFYKSYGTACRIFYFFNKSCISFTKFIIYLNKVDDDPLNKKSKQERYQIEDELDVTGVAQGLIVRPLASW